MKQEKTRCLNCQTEFDGNYCPECGQAASTKRFNMSEIIVSIISSLYSGDNKFFSTCLCLMYKPGYLVRDFLLGQRTRYYKPLPLLVFLITIYVIVTYLMNDAVTFFDLLDMASDEKLSSPTLKEVTALMNSLFSNRVYFCMFSIIINLLPYRMIFSRQKIERPDGTCDSLNVAEHFFTLSYLMCMNMLLSFILLPFSLIDGSRDIIQAIFIYCPTIFTIIIYKQLLSISWMKSLVLNLVSLIVCILSMTILFLLFTGIIYGYDNTCGNL